MSRVCDLEMCDLLSLISHVVCQVQLLQDSQKLLGCEQYTDVMTVRGIYSE